jgi:hypothetical protein
LLLFLLLICLIVFELIIKLYEFSGCGLYATDSCAETIIDTSTGSLVFNKQMQVKTGYNELLINVALTRGNIFRFNTAFINVDSRYTAIFAERHWLTTDRIFCNEPNCDVPYYANNRRGSIKLTVDYSLNIGSYQYVYEKQFDTPDIYSIVAEVYEDTSVNSIPIDVNVTDFRRGNLKNNKNNNINNFHFFLCF